MPRSIFFSSGKRAASGAAGLLYGITLLSGATALAHQIAWTRRMVDLLGAGAGSTARVFGCFFLGLSLGSWIGGRLALRVRRPWRWLGGAELVIALLCIPMLFVSGWADGIWPRLGPNALMGWPGATVKTILSVALVLPPATVMGLFLPLAVAGWPGRGSQRDPGIWLYAVNTAGAVAGVIGATVFLLPRLGMQGAMAAAMAMNGITAAGLFILDARTGPACKLPVAEQVRGQPPDRKLLAVAALSGALFMGMEIIALGVIQLAAPLSFFAPAAILASFIALMALAALAVAVWTRTHDHLTAALWLVPLATGILLALSPLGFRWFAARVPVAAASPSLAWFLVRLSLFCLLTFGPAVFAAGLWFPLAAASALKRESEATGRAGLQWGWLLAANGLGGLAGAELAYAVLLPAFGPFAGLGAIGFLYVVAAWGLRPDCVSRVQRWLPAAGMAAVLILLSGVLSGLPAVHGSFAPSVRAQAHGRDGSLAILDHPAMGLAMLSQNQYVLGSSRATPEQERQAHLPLLLHPRPRRVAFIGLATGITAGGALAHSAVEEIEAVEISREVAHAAATWFHDWNRGVMQDPRARIHIEDGRTWLAAHTGAFDVIISDLFLPWGPGEGRLYSLEHIQAARRALRPDGMFCLWLPMYQLTEPQFEVILQTFLRVFPNADLYRREFAPDAPAVALIGWNGPAPVSDTVARRLQEEHGLSADPEWAAALAALRLGGATADSEGAPINTLGNLRVELDAGRIRLLQAEKAPYLFGDRWEDWLGRFTPWRAHYSD